LKADGYFPLENYGMTVINPLHLSDKKYIFMYIHLFLLYNEVFMVTKVFRSGNSLAVRIPAKLHIGKAGDEVEIALSEGQLIVSPQRRSLKGLMNRFAAFDPDFMKHSRDQGEEPERSW
jgi:antitoxin VapB